MQQKPFEKEAELAGLKAELATLEKEINDRISKTQQQFAEVLDEVSAEELEETILSLNEEMDEEMISRGIGR